MDWRVFSSIAEELFPRTSGLFLSCAAEPLMAKHVRDVLDVVRQAEIPFVAFTTNALLFDEEMVRKIIESGIKEIYVSFDGATEATFASIRGGASMQKVIEKIRLFNQIKDALSVTSPKIEFHVTLVRGNIEEIEQIIGIARDLRVSRVTALHVHPFPELGLKEESLSNHKELYDACIAGARRRARELGVEFEAPPMFSELAQQDRTLDARDSRDRICLLPWSSTMILADGDVVPCTLWHAGESFGNLKEQRFWDIWYGTRYRRLREEIRSRRLREQCVRCPGRHSRS